MKKIISTLICVATIPNAFANDLPLNQHLGNYTEVNLDTLFGYEIFDAAVSGFGWGAAFGHYFNKTIALEGGFMQAMSRWRDDEKVNVPYLTTRFNIPMGQRFSFIAKLGLMTPFIHGDGVFLLPYTGVGVGYAVNKNLDLTLQYQGLVWGIAGVGMLGLGLTYHFS